MKTITQSNPRNDLLDAVYNEIERKDNRFDLAIVIACLATILVVWL